MSFTERGAEAEAEAKDRRMYEHEKHHRYRLYGCGVLDDDAFNRAQKFAHGCHYHSRVAVETCLPVQEALEALATAAAAYRELSTHERQVDAAAQRGAAAFSAWRVAAKRRRIHTKAKQVWKAMDAAHLKEHGFMYFPASEMTGSGGNAEYGCGEAATSGVPIFPNCLTNPGMCGMCEEEDEVYKHTKAYRLGSNTHYAFWHRSFDRKGGVAFIAPNATLLTLLEASKRGSEALKRTADRLYKERNLWVDALLRSLESDAWTMPRLSSDCYPALPGYGLTLRLNGTGVITEVNTVWKQQHENVKMQLQTNTDKTLFRGYTHVTEDRFDHRRDASSAVRKLVMQLVVPERWGVAHWYFLSWMRVRFVKFLLMHRDRVVTGDERVLHMALVACDAWFRSLLYKA